MTTVLHKKIPEKTRVLVVDDDPALCEVVADAIERRGYQVRQAPSGNAALNLILSEPIDIVISDALMPDGSGMELVSALKTSPSPQPPVLIMTGYADLTTENAIAAGAHHVFFKPFDAAELIAKLDETIGFERPPKLKRT